MEKSNKMITKKEKIQKQLLQETENIAKQLLKDIGIKLHLLGFEYWIEALIITIDIEKNNREKLRMVELYYMVARKFKTTPSKVERAMRHAYSNIDVNQYFNVTYRINNTALLFLLKDTILEKFKTI